MMLLLKADLPPHCILHTAKITFLTDESTWITPHYVRRMHWVIVRTVTRGWQNSEELPPNSGHNKHPKTVSSQISTTT